ncbi:MAG TPA: nucleoside diphosphate kinase regulator [Steroidobacteraceae bacterium]|nr:nucleoside diphosphate kinase regulator [Steroidobacteraceae bacterium]
MNALTRDPSTPRPAIVVTEADARRLRGMLAARRESALRDEAHLDELESELERALLVTADAVPPDVVVMDSAVRVRDLSNDEPREYTLVYPAEADLDAGRISVLAPLGTALLGFREGDEVEWLMPGGLRRLRIERVRSRHEAAVRH